MTDVKERILHAAVKVAEKERLTGINRKKVADEALVSTGLVSYHFYTMENLRESVVLHAIENEILSIVAEAIVDRHHLVEIMTIELKQAALSQYWK